MSAYTYKRITPELYADLVHLYESAFKQKVDTAYYRHKFATDYLGVSHLGFIAYDENYAPAAFYGVYPYLMEYKEKTYLAAQSGDTMTHPAHSGKGLFTTLAKMTYELAKQEGVQFIFGFPNDNSYPGFVKKLNWTHKENMSNFTFNVSTLPLAAIAKRAPALSGLYNLYSRFILSLFKSSLTFLPSSVINGEYGSVVRNAPYHQYKSFYRNFLVTINGFNTWVKIDGALLVGDIELKKGIDTDIFIQSLKKLAFCLGCTKVIFPVGKGTAWHQLLSSNYPEQEGIYIGYLDLQSGLPLEKFKYVFADFDTF